MNGKNQLSPDKKISNKQLNLSEDVDWPTVKKIYRSLIAAWHPDKGGDTLEFMVISEAYELLSAVYNR